VIFVLPFGVIKNNNNNWYTNGPTMQSRRCRGWGTETSHRLASSSSSSSPLCRSLSDQRQRQKTASAATSPTSYRLYVTRHAWASAAALTLSLRCTAASLQSQISFQLSIIHAQRRAKILQAGMPFFWCVT